MKIDLLNSVGSFITEKKVSEESKTSFSDILCSKKELDKVEDELLGLISSLINNLNTQDFDDINLDNESSIRNFKSQNDMLNSLNLLDDIKDSISKTEEKKATNILLNKNKEFVQLINNIQNFNYDKSIEVNGESNNSQDLKVSLWELKSKVEELIIKEENNENLTKLDKLKYKDFSDVIYERADMNKFDLLESKTSNYNLYIKSEKAMDIAKMNIDILSKKKEVLSEKILTKEQSKLGNEDIEKNILKRLAFVENDFSINSQNKTPQTIKISNLETDIVQAIKYLHNNSSEELNLKMSPKELGDMTIKIIKNEKESKILITLSKEDVFDLLSKNIKELETNLSSLDLKVKEVSVEIRSENQNDFSQSFKRNSNQEEKKQRSYKHTEEISENVDTVNIEESNINILA